jgi:hypothetical protein
MAWLPTVRGIATGKRLDVVSAAIRVRPLTAKMPFPEFGVGREALIARAAARSNAPPRRADGEIMQTTLVDRLATMTHLRHLAPKFATALR